MLRDALASLARQSTRHGPSYEIVVVDNGSTDHTRDVVTQSADNCPVAVRYVFEAEPGIVPARNRAVKEARAPWIAWFDDDELAERDWLEQLYGFAQRTGARCIGGAMRLDLSEEQRAALGPAGRAALRENETHWGHEPRKCRKREMPGTCNLLLHRSLLEAVGMFDRSMTGGGSDFDLMIRIRRAGFDVWYLPAAVVYHRIPPSRLTPVYFNWDALQSGTILAHCDVKYRGRAVTACCLVARLGQALLINLPLWLLALLRGDHAAAMVRRSLLHRAEGYLRTALARLVPFMFSEARLRERVNFRKGRALDVAAAASTPAWAANREQSAARMGRRDLAGREVRISDAG
jgi:GT2 family glycosyltransferase